MPRTVKQKDKVVFFDTTLRDGAQTRGMDFSLEMKQAIGQLLDDSGMFRYVEGGIPGVNNPVDDAYFAEDPKFKNAILTAFARARGVGKSAGNDGTLNAVYNSKAKAICVVAKACSLQVRQALETTPEENLHLIGDTMRFVSRNGRESMMDAEHFFDGFKRDKKHALAALAAARNNGARWLVLCDTNGGTMPWEIDQVVREVVAAGFKPEELGIHTHNDTEQAVANSLMAIRAGARMVQGTLAGLGERTGNANMFSIVPTVKLKMPEYDTGITRRQLRGITAMSRKFDGILDREHHQYAPYVGAAAFYTMAGIHASAIVKAGASLYAHEDPESVGNDYDIGMSSQAGLANLKFVLDKLRLPFDKEDARMKKVLDWVKDMAAHGWTFDQGKTTFELAVKRALTDDFPLYFAIDIIEGNYSFRPERHDPIRHRFKGYAHNPKSNIDIIIGDKRLEVTSQGVGPVDAIDKALRKALEPHYPQLKRLDLKDFKVRVRKGGSAAVAIVHVEAEGRVDGKKVTYSTVGAHTNNTQAAAMAFLDFYEAYLHDIGVKPKTPDLSLLQELVVVKNAPMQKSDAPRKRA